MGLLDGKTALITGCGRLKGLGRGITQALAAEGAAVAVTDVAPGGVRNKAEGDDPEAEVGWRGLDSLIEEITDGGGRAFGVVGDVGVKDDAERMVGEVLDHFGRIDILVNNAGAPHGADRTWMWEVPEEAFDAVIRVNTKGPFLMGAAVARHMVQRDGTGRIINIASDAGKFGFPKRAAYCASKFAVIGLTQTMALELAPHGVTVNAICPGRMNTSRMSSTALKVAAGEEGGKPDEPVGRIGEPSDIGNAVVFLSSPASDYVTGQSLAVNGGLLMW